MKMIFNADDVKRFVLSEEYESQLIMDPDIVSEPSVQLNRGFLKPGAELPPAFHEAPEIYYILSGVGSLEMDGEWYPVRSGTVVFIPTGIYHRLRNESETEDLSLLTVWADGEYNTVKAKRKEAWGTTFILEKPEEK